MEINKKTVNMLNVFPVPDGDTGTNMFYTVSTAVKETEQVTSGDISDLAAAYSKGALKGARGNSGVILSQILKGIAGSAKDKTEITAKDFAQGMKVGTEIAYSAVTKPKEGTILTVFRVMTEKALEITSKRRKEVTFEDFFTKVIAAGEDILNKTPDMLPVLKKAGVVDAGGKGLLCIFQGYYNALAGIEMPDVVEDADDKPSLDAFERMVEDDLDEIHFGYCTEYFITNLKKKVTLSDIDKLRDYLMTIGDCVLVIGDLSLVKVHVHTNNPDRALNAALKLGELDRLKIENMMEQNRQLLKKREEEKKHVKPVGMVSVCAGEGMASIFKDLGVDYIVEGGQTMNPSVYDILTAINKVNAESVIVFPNNKNIILAVEQAKDLAEKKVYMIPTVNCPQGISAIVAYNPEVSVEDNLGDMTAAADHVKCGQITHAVRNTKINGFSLKEGDIIGLDDKKVVAKGATVNETVQKTIEKLLDDEIVSINLYYGEDVTDEEAEILVEELSKVFEDQDVAAYPGGQPHYYYLVSLE